MERLRKNAKLYTLGLLFITNLFIWHAVVTEESRTKLTTAFLDVGQGDSIFIEAPNGNQILIDGGPGKSTLREIGKLMPYYDRSIDMLIVTNPDKDHFAGFIDVLRRYHVEGVLLPGTISNTAAYGEFEKIIKEKGVKKALARRGMNIDLGDGVSLSILFPDRDVSNWKTNDGSVVTRLSYGEKSFLFMGDSTVKTEGIIIFKNSAGLKSDVLKLGHHGSRTSTSAALLGYANPSYAIISAGRNNSYGHPHKEVLALLEKFKIPHLITYEEGTIVFETDGEQLNRQSF